MEISITCPWCRNETGLSEVEDALEEFKVFDGRKNAVYYFLSGAHIHCLSCNQILNLKIMKPPESELMNNCFLIATCYQQKTSSQKLFFA